MSMSATATHALYGSSEPRLPTAEAVRSVWLDRVMLWLLSAFAFVLPTDLRFSDEKSVAMRLGYVCLLLGIAGLFRRRTFVLPRNGFWWLVAFVAWSSCSLAWARFPEDAQHKVLLYVVIFAMTAIIPQYAWDARLRARLMDAYLAGCGLGAVGTIIHFALERPYVPPDDLEVKGRYSFGTDPNYLALALVIGIPLALYRSNQSSALWKRMLAWAYVPVAVGGVFLTGSRGALIAFAVAIVGYAMLTGVRALRLILVGAGLCLAIGGLLPGQIVERFTSIPDELQHGSLSDRRELWDRGTAVVAQHPLEGIGAGATTGELEIAAHNTPLELMMEGGAVGASLFYGAILFGLLGAWKNDRREGRTLVALWSAWLVGAFSLSWEINTITWFMFALLFSASSAWPEGRGLRTLSRA